MLPKILPDSSTPTSSKPHPYPTSEVSVVTCRDRSSMMVSFLKWSVYSIEAEVIHAVSSTKKGRLDRVSGLGAHTSEDQRSQRLEKV